MATLYQKRGVWYLTVQKDCKIITRSLGTKDKKTALILKPKVESELVSVLRHLGGGATL